MPRMCRCPNDGVDGVDATTDLIAPVNPDFIFPCRDVPALTELLQERFPIQLN
jgi:hypothetical protein